ncbi:(deoxy)nucleoside triphosphate pyrophosphohydrolase [Granulicella cerasi]|uniref:8-oxo-dGTP diphosphatase n=1 Tax=Granulicella cerasi TaxID=741063 RepID=A0ABW1Z3E4_9BACT|nr:(deoxy)nucleoside triphosphate pyrophosphohydrolase [Granulicella cerasi]
MKRPIRKLNGRRPSALQAKPVRHVVAALILRGEGSAREVFICQRRADQPMGHKWEFPGGKIEPGETAEIALARELNEELGIDAVIGEKLTTVRHNYRNGASIEIQFFTVTEFRGELENRIFQNMLWSPFSKLPEYDFLTADLELIRDLADGKLL